MYAITLVIQCPDKKGIIADVTSFVYQQKGNIQYIDQYVDRENGAFFMRLQAELDEQLCSYQNFIRLFENELANEYNMTWSHQPLHYKPKMAVFVSKYDHCLYDILAQQSSGKLACTIPFIISNHKDLEPIAKQFNIPFYHIAVSKDTKEEAEIKQLELLKKYEVNCIVLARYMQIVSSRIIDVYPSKIINIHHSFLPAFPGAKPYHSAFQRGVKIIGATSHYVTEELDAGPIIEQDIIRVSHGHEVKDFILKGQDLERIVLLRALKLHCERKIMTYNNKTIVFN